MAQHKKPFNKPWLAFDDQLDLLANRGLIITDKIRAKDFLSHINYYRFSGYCLAFEIERHKFRDNTTFEHIVDAYDFDSGLRNLIAQAVAVVEIDIRTAIAHHFGRHYGALGHTDADNFFGRSFNHSQWLNKLHGEAQRSSEQFIVHFKKTYKEFPDLPIWVIPEIMSFGSLSMMFGGMKKDDQRKIAGPYHLQNKTMGSWMHHLVYIRNICAHHSRLWDRVWSIKPALPVGKNFKPPVLNNNNRVFVTLLILKYLLAKIPSMADYTKNWQGQVIETLQNPPAIANARHLLGLEDNWQFHPLWD